MKKILIITYYWPPAGGPGVQRWLKFAKYLPEFGWEPIVLTVDENYASYPQVDTSLLDEVSGIEVHKTKSIEVLELYSRFSKGKQIPYGGFSNEGDPSFLKKVSRFIRGNFFIPDPRKAWNKHAYKKAVELVEKHNIEVVVTTSPPHSTQLIGLKLKKNNIIKKWVADLRDPWTDIFYYNKFYPTKWARKVDRNLEAEVINNCDELITISDSNKDVYDKRYGNEDKIHVLTNGFDTADFPQQLFEVTPNINEFLYTGTVSSEYPIEEVVSVAKIFTNHTFRFIGNVHPYFLELVEKEGLSERFIFQKSISHSEIVKEMTKAGILLLLIPKMDNNEGILTGKLFEYLGSKRPIFAIGPKNGDVKGIIEKTKRGIYLDYNSVADIKQDDLQVEKTGDENEEYLNYSRKSITSKFVKIINIVKK